MNVERIRHNLIKKGYDRHDLDLLIHKAENVGFMKGLNKARTKEQSYFDTLAKLERHRKMIKEKELKELTSCKQ